MTTATDKQINFLRTLASDRVTNDAERDVLASFLGENALALDKSTASAWIGTLLKREKISINASGVVKPSETVEPGYYVVGESYYEVVLSKAGRAYAKVLTHHGDRWSWDYAKGAIQTITSDDRLTEEQAAEFGWLHNHCMRCLKELTVQKSIDQGYGPVCAGYMGIA